MLYNRFRTSAVILLLLLLALPASAQAGNFFDFFKGGAVKQTSKSVSDSEADEEKSRCGKQIDTFRVFMHDAKICKQDDDCITMNGICPLGCKFYINKNFEQIIQTEAGKVREICTESVCSYKCPKMNIRPVCVQNKCQARVR